MNSPYPTTLPRAACGTPLGIEAHRAAREQPCTWCRAAAGLPPVEHEAAEPRGFRHYLIGAAVIGTDKPNGRLRRMLASGAARELAPDETRTCLAGGTVDGRG